MIEEKSVISNFSWLVIVGNGIACFLFGLVVGRLARWRADGKTRTKEGES